MKKIILALAAALVLSGINASAQYTAVIGYANQWVSESPTDAHFHGFYAGLKYDIAFSNLEGLTFEPGANFVFGNDGGHSKSYSINVPLDLKYTFYDFAPGVSLSGFTGPRLNIGLAGSAYTDYKGKTDDGTTYKGGEGIKRFQLQWGLGAALIIADAVQVRLSYDFGVHDALRDDTDLADDAKPRFQALMLGFGFLF